MRRRHEPVSYTHLGSSGSPWIVLDIREGQGWALRGVPESYPSVSKEKESIELSSPRTLAVDSLGQLSDYPLESSLRALINNWFVVAPTSIQDVYKRQTLSLEDIGGLPVRTQEKLVAFHLFHELGPDADEVPIEAVREWLYELEGSSS